MGYLMKISAQDSLAWEVVAQVIKKNEPAEYRYLGDIIDNSLNDKPHQDIAGAFDVGDAVQYVAHQLFPVIKYVIAIIAPDILHGLSAMTLEQLKKILFSSEKGVSPQVKYSPAEVRKIVLAVCRKKKLSGEVADSIADAIALRLLMPPER